MPDAPCKDCPDRRVTESENCHMTCAAYLAFSRERRRLCDEDSFQTQIRAEHVKSVYKTKKRLNL